ncbi:MAG TPA: prepilin-type N-terminal cleavage/methylation domain-containing protein [Patescibacteria group bacterium]|jgi:prepilin-type N-terminal cleavage/methylation domain-containing protein
MKRIPPSSTGFSLIELLVVIAISLILLGGAISALVTFNERRSVTNAVDELKTMLQAAQSKARAGDLGGCDQLAGYRLQTYLNGNVTEMSLQAVCSAGVATAAQLQALPVGVTITPNLDATFQVLNAGVQLPNGVASIDLTIANNTHSYLITLYREGRINEGAWQ